jgi:hypothetical protein
MIDKTTAVTGKFNNPPVMTIVMYLPDYFEDWLGSTWPIRNKAISPEVNFLFLFFIILFLDFAIQKNYTIRSVSL